MTEIRTQGDLDRATATLIGLAESGVRMYRGACQPACGMRRRGWPEAGDTIWLQVGADLAPLMQSLIGVDLHVQWGEVEFDGAPIEVVAGSRVNFSVVPNGRKCGACGHAEIGHGMGPDARERLDWYCQDCVAEGTAAAWHRPEIALEVRGEPL